MVKKITRSFFSRGVFVTGTDTAIGKTVVAAALAAWWRSQEIDVGVAKPVAAGGRRIGGRLISEDAILLARAAGVDDPLPLINPVCPAGWAAPWVSAQAEGKSVRVASALAAYRALARRHARMIVEGAGGLLVPLTRRYLVIDLARDIGLPLLIVAHPGLGTINHTLLTIDAARRRGLPIAGVVFNEYEQPAAGSHNGLAWRTNPAVIETLGCARILATLRFDPQVNVRRASLGRLPQALGRQLGQRSRLRGDI